MDAVQAAQAIREGKTVRVTVGDGEEDPVLLAWLDDFGGVVSHGMEGWSAGVSELVCAAESDYLEKMFLAGKADLTVVDRPAFLTTNREW